MKPANHSTGLITLSGLVCVSVLTGLAYFKVQTIAQTAASPQMQASARPLPATTKPVIAGKQTWKELSTTQKKVLQPLQAEWDRIDGLNQAKWLQIANRFVSLKPDEQKRIQKRMELWAALSPEQKQIARLNYSRTKKIETAQKTKQWELYQQLPVEKKQLLASGVPFQLAGVQSPKMLADTISTANAENAAASATEQASASASLTSDVEVSASPANPSDLPAAKQD